MVEWNDSPELRPAKADFDPFDGDLDALNAWKNFGGLYQAEAYEKFCALLSVYQEDFMFMGRVAFAYYYPVLERYILASRVDNDGNDVEAMSGLAHCIKSQFETRQGDYAFRARILKVVSHVRGNLAQYSVDSDEQGRIDTSWSELERMLRDGFVAG